jgi:hypothetical protein
MVMISFTVQKFHCVLLMLGRLSCTWEVYMENKPVLAGIRIFWYLPNPDFTNNLQKDSFSLFFFLNLYTEEGYQVFYRKFWISSHSANSHKFDNNKFSFDDSHKLNP